MVAVPSRTDAVANITVLAVLSTNKRSVIVMQHNPVLDGGCSDMGSPLNVIHGTIQPLSEERDAVASGVHRAPSSVTTFAPPSIDGDAQGRASAPRTILGGVCGFMGKAYVSFLGVSNRRAAPLRRFWRGALHSSPDARSRVTDISKAMRSSMSSQWTSPMRSTCWLGHNKLTRTCSV